MHDRSITSCSTDVVISTNVSPKLFTICHGTTLTNTIKLKSCVIDIHKVVYNVKECQIMHNFYYSFLIKVLNPFHVSGCSGLLSIFKVNLHPRVKYLSASNRVSSNIALCLSF